MQASMPSCQVGGAKPNALPSLEQSNVELCGLLAGVGYWALGIGTTTVASPAVLKISRAKPHHEVRPEAVR